MPCLRSPSSLAAARPAALACAALACAALACTEPQAGVHVVVTMADADFSEQHLFDHLTVTASVGSRSARACLYAGADPVALDDPAPSDFACADLRTENWTGPPSAASWALERKPRTLNVEAEEGEEVEVEITGGFGGRLRTVRGAGSARASGAYPELRVVLAPGDVTVKPCGARLEPSNSPLFDSLKDPCDADRVDCPKDVSGELVRSDAVFCLDGVDDEGRKTSRVQNTASSTCDKAPIVWHTDSLPKPKGKECVSSVVTGHFVRCKDGDPRDPAGCVETTDCTPGPVYVWSRTKDIDTPALSSVALDCLPPLAVPMTWSVPLLLPADPDQLVVYGLSQNIASAADACFIDVQAVGIANNCDPQ